LEALSDQEEACRITMHEPLTKKLLNTVVRRTFTCCAIHTWCDS